MKNPRFASCTWKFLTLVGAVACLVRPVVVCAAPASIELKNPAGALITQAVGRQSIQLEIVSPTTMKRARIVVQVAPYDAHGAPAAWISPARTSVWDLRPGSTQMTVNVNLGHRGLFLVNAQLLSTQGTALAHKAFNLAVIPRRGHTGPGDFGVATHFAQGKGAPEILLPLIRNAGFSWIRDELYWDQIEKQPGRMIFPPRFDAYLLTASRLKITPLIVLSYGNATAYPELFKRSPFPQSSEARAHFRRYVAELLERYDKEVKHWEVWNEPEFGKIGYDNYVNLLKDVYVEIKQRSPDASVISCGGGGSGGGPGGDCLTELIQRGALDYQDGFSIHPYMSPNTPEIGYRAIGAPIESVSIPSVWPYLKAFVARNPKTNGQLLQLWVTEFGWPVRRNVPGQNEAMQAAYLIRSYLLSRRYNAARVLFWYDFADDGIDPDDIEQNFGLLHSDFTPKPAFIAAAVLSSTLENRAWAKSLFDDDEVKVYQYDAVNPLLVGWTSGAQEREVSLHLPPGDYVQRDWQGIDSPMTVTAQGFDWHLGPMPRYLFPLRQGPSHSLQTGMPGEKR